MNAMTSAIKTACRPVDHLVVAGPTLELAVELVADVVGVVASGGGPHPGRGTRNALVGLGRGCYLEAIGPDPEQPDPDRPRAFGIDQLRSPGLVTWAARVPRLAEFVGGLKTVSFSEPSSMSRRLDDGSLLQWELSFPREPAVSLVQPVPFLIDWGVQRSPGFELPKAAQLQSLTVVAGTRCEEVIAALPEVAPDAGVDVLFEQQSSVRVPRLHASVATGDRVCELSS